MRARVEHVVSEKLALAVMIDIRKKGQTINKANFIDGVRDELKAYGSAWDDSLGDGRLVWHGLTKGKIYEYELAWQDLKKIGFKPSQDPYFYHRQFSENPNG